MLFYFFLHVMQVVCNKVDHANYKNSILFEYYFLEKVGTLNREKSDIYINTKSNFQNQFPTCTAQLKELTAFNIRPMKLFTD